MNSLKRIGKLKTHTSAELRDRGSASMLSIGFECLDRELFDPEKCYAPLGESGIRYARVQTGWARCEKEKGVINFGWLDDIVDHLLDIGVEPWFNMGFGNRLYMPDVPPHNTMAVGCVPLYYGEECLFAWKRFVRALTEHYKDRITHYEIWNEPNIEAFWYPAVPDAEKLSELVTLTARIILEAQPDARIGTCISEVTNLKTGYEYAKAFLKAFPLSLDFLSIHRYALIPELNWAESVRYLHRLLEQYGQNDTELWMGEGGYPSWFPENHWLHPKSDNRGSEHQQAVFMARRVLADAALGIRMHSFFQMADMWERPYAKARDLISKPAAQGILNGKVYTKKLSYYVYSRLAVLLENAKPLETVSIRWWFDAVPEAQLSLQHFALQKDNRPVYIWYYPSDIQEEHGTIGEAELACETTRELLPMEHPVILDILSGEIFEAEGTLREDGWFGKAPLCEYPVILCDASLLETNISG